MASFIIPLNLKSKMNNFIFQELFYAHREAEKFHANNKFPSFSYEGMIATYKFRWTDKNCYLDDLLLKKQK